jgi:UDP-N-acetylglucosamine 2-epimerase (non-hydrolysing)
MGRTKIVTIIGTRPEAIKMAPVIKELKRQSPSFEQVIVSTAQHKQMLDQVLQVFGIEPDLDLDLMQENQSLAGFASRSLASLSETLSRLEPQAVLVQGDTTTGMTAALAAFYLGIRIGHVEAGLRSFDKRRPFPEEGNRRVGSCLADLHFAPTEGARRNLRNEGVPDHNIYVTGNTIVDALRMIPLGGQYDDQRLNELYLNGNRLVLVTAHRRENHGAPLASICRALKALTNQFADLEIVYPVHSNPNVCGPAYRELRSCPRIHLVKPVSYRDLLKLMDRCYMILTDSGGIQEEAPSFGKPVLILRDVTERPEVLESGAGRLVGTNTDHIVDEARSLLTSPDLYGSMSRAQNPFGDGHAAERIVRILVDRL